MKCRLCDSENLYLYYTQGNKSQYKFYKCKECKLVNYDLSTGLDQGKYALNKYPDPTDMSIKQNIDQTSTYNYIIKNVNSKGKMLDIGCGNGKILLLARQDGWDVHGLELSDFLAKSIKSKFGINVDVSNFLDYEINPDEQYDVVILRHVLEHLPDSIKAMQKINSLMKKNGFGILEFPNIESNQMKLKRLFSNFGLYKKKYRESYVPGHCNEFCKDSFSYLASASGFKLLKWQNYSSNEFLTKYYNLINFGTKARVLIQKV